MMRAKHFAMASVVALIAAAGQVQAGFVIGAVAATTTYPTVSGWEIERVIDQSGLSAPYVSGVTDFATYCATNSNTRGTVFGGGPRPGFATFDLGAAYDLSGIAIYVPDPTYGGSLNTFNLRISDDADFTGKPVFFVGDLNPAGLTKLSFAIQTGRFVQLEVLTSNGLDHIRFDELWFDGTSASSPVPEPSSIALLTIGTCVTASGAVRRRSRRWPRFLEPASRSDERVDTL